MTNELYTRPEVIGHAMDQAYQNGEEMGEPVVLPFATKDVERLHTHMKGRGDGIWFRLKDGRVFDSYGDETPADPALYDTVEN